MYITMIAAIGANNEIGKDGGMPWSCKEDMKWFREQTEGKTVIMGRKTFESIGKCLPNRLNIIVTRQEDFDAPEGAVVTNFITRAMEAATEHANEIMIIGGGQLYEELMPIADRLLITHFEQSFEADAYFPDIDPKYWTGMKQKDGEHCTDDLQYSFWEYLRNDQPRAERSHPAV